MDKTTLLKYYNEFIIKQDYFECHEIMEEAWKAKENFSKKDDEILFIQLSTAEYHYRRNNLYGARKIYNRAVRRLDERPFNYEKYGLKKEFIPLIKERLGNLESDGFKPLYLPLTDSMYESLHAFSMPESTLEEFYHHIKKLHKKDIILVQKHRLRDRSEIIDVRNEKLLKKRDMDL